MALKNIGILGVGMSVPEKVMTNFDFEKIIDTSDEWIKTRTGIEKRHIARDGEGVSDIAQKAAIEALEEAGVDPLDVDLIIFATSTPDYLVQNAASVLQLKIGAKNAAGFDLNAACSGFVYGLSVGYGLLKSGLYKKILVIGGDTLSKTVDLYDRSVSVLFGDGAAAAVLGEVEEGYGVVSQYLMLDGVEAETLRVPHGGSKNALTKESFENGNAYLKMNGKEVFKFAVNAIPKAVGKTLEMANLKADDLKLIVPHQANKRIIDSAAKRLGISKDKFYMNIQKYGNTSAASIGIALKEALKEDKVKKGDYIALTGFGAGLAYGSIILKWAY